MLILWAWTGLLSAAVLIPVYTGEGTGIIPLGVAAVALLLYTLMAPGWTARHTNGNGDTTGQPPPPDWHVPDLERDQPTR